MIRCSILILLAFFLRSHGYGNTPLLERVITLSIERQRLDEALKIIAKEGGFEFSYSPNILDVERLVTHDFVRKSVREILDVLFQGKLQYKTRGKYIILTRNESQEATVVSGYVVDEATGARLRNVSVYDPVTLTSAVTDSYGFFEIKIDKPPTELRLSVSKENYSDTLLAIPEGNRGRLLNIPIQVDKEKIITFADSLGSKMKRFWKNEILSFGNINLLNIHDTLYRDYQFSVVPFVGTNHKLSGNVINDYSFNLLGGYSLGVKKVEFGGLFNIERGNAEGVQIGGAFNTVFGRVDGVQLAGLFNAVGEDVRGVQLAGGFNANRKPVDGVQLAGLINFNWMDHEKFSGAGVINFSREGSRGVTLSGISNFSGGIQKGFHAAGVMNFSAKDAGPVQWAGVLNFTGGNFRGWQSAGLFNITQGETKGLQTAGLINVSARRTSGAQIGLVNYTRRMKGVQIGLLNMADSVKGVPMGFMSLVAKGYHKIELSADDIFYANLAFRTGVPQFYNIFLVGAKPETFRNDHTFWTFGYGIGTAPRISRGVSLNIDVTAQQVVPEKSIESLKLLNKVYLGVDVKVVKGISFVAGATLNGYLTEQPNDALDGLFTDYRPVVIKNQPVEDGLYLQMWWGGKVGLRFL